MRCEIKVGKYKQHFGLTYCNFPKAFFKDTSADSSLGYLLHILFGHQKFTIFLLKILWRGCRFKGSKRPLLVTNSVKSQAFELIGPFS